MNKETNGCCLSHSAHENHDHKERYAKRWIILGVSLVSTALSYIFYALDLYSHTPYAFLDFAWIAIALCGFPILKESFESLKNKKINSSVLIAIALVASVAMGFYGVFAPSYRSHENYFFVAGEIAFLMALGELIEDITMNKSRFAIQKLIALKPTKATLKTENGYKEINIEDIEIGQTVLVRPNETVPVDGILLSESGSFDQASLTGEWQPKDLVKGQAVLASNVNLLSPVEIQATKKSEETVISKLIEYYKEAVRHKAPIAGVADKLSSKLVPIALLTALLVFCLTAGTISVTEGLGRGMAVLVVFCPCALVLATPIAIAASVGNASKKGILIKNGGVLELLPSVNTMVFDKTGTLTSGNLEVDEVVSQGMDKRELTRLAAASEMQSEHPIAKAVIRYYGQTPPYPEKTAIRSGIGVEAVVEDKIVKVMKLSQAENECPQAFDDLKKSLSKPEGATLIAVIVDDKPAGIISLKDTLKKEALPAIEELKSMGYEIVLLTGDNKESAQAVAESLGIEEYHYELMPQDKADLIEQMKAQGRITLMIGDGVNDAPAFAKSGVSLAMAKIGSEIAVETSDISLFNDGLSRLPQLMRLAKRGIFAIKFNIALALAINAITVALSAAGFLNAVWGALLHNLSSVLVALSSALLLTQKSRGKNTLK